MHRLSVYRMVGALVAVGGCSTLANRSRKNDINYGIYNVAYNMDNGNGLHSETPVKPQVHFPSFGTTGAREKFKKIQKPVTLDSMVLISGTSHPTLAMEVSKLIDKPLANAVLSRFSDGEVSCQINEVIRGRDVFIIQSAASPVNDSIIELLLTVSCARRAGARRIVAVIPYFPYKHHRRGASISTKHNSRFLSSGAMDFARMLQEMGVDRVIAVDLQRPGQGQEACFFDNNVPIETILTKEIFIDQIVKDMKFSSSQIIVVAPNAELVKKARQYQIKIQKIYPQFDVKVVAFFAPNSDSGPIQDLDELNFMSNTKVEGADVIVVDDMIDTGSTITTISKKLKDLGAKQISICASHGVFSDDAIHAIERSEINKIYVTNSLPIHSKDPPSQKIVQISIAPLLSQVILSEHYRSVNGVEEVLDLELDTE